MNKKENINYMLSLLKELKDGDKITIIRDNVFGYSETKGTFKGGLEPRGFVSDTVCGWALNEDSDYNIQSYRFKYRMYRGKLIIFEQLFHIDGIRKGW